MGINHQSTAATSKRIKTGVLAFLIGNALLLSTQSTLIPAISQALPTYFESGLTLTRAEATYDAVNAYPAVYQFTVQVPEAAKQSLSRLTIIAPENFGAFGVNLPGQEQVSAFIPGDPQAKGYQYPQRKIPAKASIDGRNINIDFPEPISPQQAVTVEFPYMRNPAKAGTYLFEVHAAPPGTNPVSQFLGFGRLVIRENHHT
jgi:hypothetical protein